MRRKAICVRPAMGADVFVSTEKPFMMKLPARCVSSSIGEPTRSSPTMALSRANVTSSLEGSGVCGANSPNCRYRSRR